jgi:hypothetical protein
LKHYFFLFHFFFIFYCSSFFSNAHFQFFKLFILIKHVLEKIIIHVNYLTCYVCCVTCKIKISLAQKYSHNKTFCSHILFPKSCKCL